MPDLQEQLQSFPWEELSKLARDAVQMAVDSGDPLSGARRAIQAVEASAAVIGESVSSGDAQILLDDAIAAISQVIESASAARPPGENAAASPAVSFVAPTDDSMRRASKLLRRFFERMGAAYVKFGQFIASSPTLFPREVIEEMQACLDNVPPLDFERDIRPAIVREMGGEAAVERTFASIEAVPLASASIAQVHRATLRSTNQAVVLKVVKPGVRETLRADLDAMYLACRTLELIDPNLEARVGLSAIVEDARASILAETDLIKERQNMQVFESFLRQAGPYFQQVTVPRTYEVRKRECECVRAFLRGVFHGCAPEREEGSPPFPFPEGYLSSPASSHADDLSFHAHIRACARRHPATSSPPLPPSRAQVRACW